MGLMTGQQLPTTTGQQGNSVLIQFGYLAKHGFIILMK